MMVDLHKPIMFVGGAGVGKTQLVKGKLATLSEDMMSLAISFNYFTDVGSFQKVCTGSGVLMWWVMLPCGSCTFGAVGCWAMYVSPAG